MRQRFLVGVIGLTLASGCAAVPPAQLGQTVGTIAGAAIAPGIGAPIGALVGMLAGLMVQGEVDKVTEKHERKDLDDRLATKPSSAASAFPPPGQPLRVWVDEALHDGRLVAGHFDIRYL